MLLHRLEHDHDEASAIASVHSRRILEAFGLQDAVWVISDEAQAHECIAILGRRHGDIVSTEGEAGTPGTPSESHPWIVIPVDSKRTKGSSRKKTDDPEAIARAGAWLYIFGSHFGSKTGPLDPERHFIARFNESLVRIGQDGIALDLEVTRSPYRLHRVINDALRHNPVDVIDPGGPLLDSYIRATLHDPDQSKWHDRLDYGDRPINIEGACFLPNGRLLVGLRYPVTAEGHPILVEVDGIDRLFIKHGSRKYGVPVATRVIVLEDVGSVEAPMGVRAMDSRGNTVHAIVGNLDSDPDESQVLADTPHGHAANNAHVTFDIVATDGSGLARLKTQTVHEFGDDAVVEGITLYEDGTIWYAHDMDDAIVLHEERGDS